MDTTRLIHFILYDKLAKKLLIFVDFNNYADNEYTAEQTVGGKEIGTNTIQESKYNSGIPRHVMGA